MSQRRFPLGLIVMAPLALGFGVYAFTGQAQVPDPDAATPTASATATATADGGLAGTATAVAEATPPSPPAFATATPEPAVAEQRGEFKLGAWVRVNAGAGDCLNARNGPSMAQEWIIINACLPDGYEGYIASTGQFADGHWWWFLAGAGWVAEDYLQFVRQEDIRGRTLPELSGRGMIAFTRQSAQQRNELWVMNADGTGQRMLRAGREHEYPQELTWTPDGRAVAFTLLRPTGPSGDAWDVHVLPIDDPAAEVVYEDAFGAEWAPDGGRFATVLAPELEGVGGGVTGVAAIIDVATGARSPLAAEPFYQQAPPSFNHDGTKLVLTYEAIREDAPDPGARIMIWDLAGNELARIVAPEGAYYARPAWSPVADQIEFHSGTTAQGQPQYVVYDLARHDIVAGARVPKASDKIGGRCGSWDMWSATWSRDGGRVLYSFDSGETGANGIWSWDVATGAQSLAPAVYASNASPGPDGYAVFSSSGSAIGYIFIASPNGGFPTLLTDGMNPVWSP